MSDEGRKDSKVLLLRELVPKNIESDRVSLKDKTHRARTDGEIGEDEWREEGKDID
jgi:hypothetical protein